MKHEMAHFGEFQALDKSMNHTKLIGLAAQIASKSENFIGAPGNRKTFEQLVKIGDQLVRVRVVINEADNLRSVHIRY